MNELALITISVLVGIVNAIIVFTVWSNRTPRQAIWRHDMRVRLPEDPQAAAAVQSALERTRTLFEGLTAADVHRICEFADRIRSTSALPRTSNETCATTQYGR